MTQKLETIISKTLLSESNVPEARDLIKALENFKKAAIELTGAWDDAASKVDDIILSTNYPFKESFDDLVPEIKKWVDSAISEVKSA